MKRLITIVCLALGMSAQCSAYDERLIHVLEQLRQCRLDFDESLPAVGGPAVGAAATPHEFFYYFPTLCDLPVKEI